MNWDYSRTTLFKHGHENIVTSHIAFDIVLTKEEHRLFTNLWREAIHYATGESGVTITKEVVLDAAKKVYKDYPEFYNIVKVFPK